MKKIHFLSILLALLLLSGCASGAVDAGTLPQPGSRLVVYTSHKEEVYRPIIREFEERTGIWVELVTGGSNELLQQLVAPPGDQLHPDARPLLKFPDDGPVHLLLMRGVNHQPAARLGQRPGVHRPGSTAGEQKQGQKDG